MKKRGMAVVEYDFVSAEKPGTRYTTCFVCTAPHEAHSIARIRDKSGAVMVALCEPCARDPAIGEAIVRIHWNDPTIAISDGGEMTVEQMLDLEEKQDATEH